MSDVGYKTYTSAEEELTALLRTVSEERREEAYAGFETLSRVEENNTCPGVVCGKTCPMNQKFYLKEINGRCVANKYNASSNNIARDMLARRPVVGNTPEPDPTLEVLALDCFGRDLVHLDPVWVGDAVSELLIKMDKGFARYFLDKPQSHYKYRAYIGGNKCGQSTIWKYALRARDEDAALNDEWRAACEAASEHLDPVEWFKGRNVEQKHTKPSRDKKLPEGITQARIDAILDNLRRAPVEHRMLGLHNLRILKDTGTCIGARGFPCRNCPLGNGFAERDHTGGHVTGDTGRSPHDKLYAHLALEAWEQEKKRDNLPLKHYVASSTDWTPPEEDPVAVALGELEPRRREVPSFQLPQGDPILAALKTMKGRR